MAAYNCNPSTKEAEAGGSLLLVQGHPSQQGELKDSPGLPRETLS